MSRMMRVYVIGVGVALLGLVVWAFVARTHDGLEDTPTAVRQAILEHTEGSRVLGIAEEMDHGRRVYEAETTRDGRTRDLMFDSAGALLSVEEEVPIDRVPEAVRTALRARGEVMRVESLTADGLVTYEAEIDTADGRAEVVLDAGGQVVGG